MSSTPSYAEVVTNSPDGYCSPIYGQYGYIPSLTTGIIFTVIFTSFTLYSLYATIRQRKWFISITLGGILEMIGWIGRAAAHTASCNSSIFIMQICCLLLAPALFSATLYILLGILIQRAPSRSILSPKMYLVIFCSVDFLSLLIQAIGGGIAGGATTYAGAEKGSHIMVAGVFVQLAGMTAFAILGLHFLVASTKKGTRYNGQVLVVAAFATVLIFIRNIYRAVELLQGWLGRLNTTEKYLIGLDGAMMVLCIASLCYLAFLDSRHDGLLQRMTAQEFARHSGDTESAKSEREKSVAGSV